MRSHAAGAAVACAVSAMLVAACGEQDRAGTVAKAPPLASAAAIESDPYAIECGHVRDQGRWATATRGATGATADREPVRGLTPPRMSQSVYYAMTELCKGRPATYEPAHAAVRGVSSGRYVALRRTH